MTGIVCAIRGGPDSQPTIDRAVELAQETKLRLYFLYVVNLDFLTHTSRSRVDTITSEMEQMGEFILLAAKSQADTAGVQAEGVIRHGQVGEEIIDLCKTKDADYAVLGQPQGEPEEDVFTHERLAEFSKRIEAESGAKVVMARGERS
jgi:nucleotide-binding universal stress UspA family protein